MATATHEILLIVDHYCCRIHYSERYSDDEYEYRHVILPKGMLKYLPETLFSPEDPNVLRLLSESEWRGIGITQSLGWEHYEVHGKLLVRYAPSFATH
jgi:cyclin-dependent kinase regulatory subunit CKS1